MSLELPDTPRAVEYVAPCPPRIVIQGEFGVEGMQVTINYLVLPLEQAVWLRDALDRAIRRADG